MPKKLVRGIKLSVRFFLQRLAWPALYWLCSRRAIDTKLVVFASEFSSAPPDNFVPLLLRLEELGYDCRFFGFRAVRGGFFRKKLAGYRDNVRFFRAYGRCRTLFLDDHFFPAYGAKPRQGTQVVQLWHGCGAFKKFGYSTAGTDWGSSARVFRFLPSHHTYTHVCVSAPAVVPCYAEAFHCAPEIIHPWGAPRTDAYFRPGAAAEARAAVLAVFPEIGDRKILLYAPTFRGDNILEATDGGKLDMPSLAEVLGDVCALVYKAHPRAKRPEAGNGAQGFVFDGGTWSIETLLLAADLTITDYSSLIFEYALLGRPMLFYAYDLEEYDRRRSFYYDYASFVPGEIVRDTGELTAGIQRALARFDGAKTDAFRGKFMSACDGCCTKRILQELHF
ncbi:MAG: CDP-glycerol glycerophosphotransferase family protein [Oscillospiraceae bacterium]|jgi:CDP-ribitol ribitolphosphotransferase|nr:CDP-glycerol glycerophosphotransferase family protein [Oscillospiraceae bacterium]